MAERALTTLVVALGALLGGGYLIHEITNINIVLPF